MLKSLLLEDLKVYFTTHDVRQGLNLTTNKTIRFTQKTILNTKLGFVQSHSGAFNNPPKGYFQKIAGIYKS